MKDKCNYCEDRATTRTSNGWPACQKCKNEIDGVWFECFAEEL